MRNGDASGNGGLAVRRISGRKPNRKQCINLMVFADAEDFDVAVDIGQINPRAVW